MMKASMQRMINLRYGTVLCAKQCQIKRNGYDAIKENGTVSNRIEVCHVSSIKKGALNTNTIELKVENEYLKKNVLANHTAQLRCSKGLRVDITWPLHILPNIHLIQRNQGTLPGAKTVMIPHLHSSISRSVLDPMIAFSADDTIRAYNKLT